MDDHFPPPTREDLVSAWNRLRRKKPPTWEPCDPMCHGWEVFFSPEYGYEIQRCDDCARFKSDEGAEVHVFWHRENAERCVREINRIEFEELSLMGWEYTTPRAAEAYIRERFMILNDPEETLEHGS